MAPTRIAPFIQNIFIALFCAQLALPAAGMFMRTAPQVKFSENRRLAALPALPRGWRELPAFCSAFEAYFKDRFAFRTALIQLHTVFKVKLLAQSPNRKVIIGRGGWLYFTGEDERLLRYDPPFSGDELRQILVATEARKRWFENSGALFFLIVAPNKQSIYPEFLPQLQAGWIKHHNLYDQLCDYFGAHSAMDILIDVKADMLREKAFGRPMYYRTDSHWNSPAAWLAYMQIMRCIQKYRPAAVALKAEDYSWERRPYSGDLVSILGIRDLFQEHSEFAEPRRAPAAAITEAPTELDGVPLKYPALVSQSPRGADFTVVVCTIHSLTP